MPEYPEVATLINTLLSSKGIINKKIVAINFFDPKILKNATTIIFENFLIKESFLNIFQIGKLIVFSLSNNKYLTVHLRLEGKLFFVNKNDKVNKFCMVEIYLENGKKIIYEDFRKFGTFCIYKNKNELINSSEVIKLGKQPFSQDLTSEYLFSCLKNKSIPIKSCLLDQSIIAGIGNIYADEVLFACKLHPLKKAKFLTIKDCEKIIFQTRKIMQQAIKHYGTTVFSFKFAPNHSGNFQKYLKVYSRKNKPCLKCGALIKKIKINGRGTCYCPNCQKLN